MFRVGQIITSTKLIKNFSRIATHIFSYPQAILITHRSGRHLVLMDAELFDQMMERATDKEAAFPQGTGLKYELEPIF